MKKLLSLTLILFCCAANADEIYKCVDENGKVRFSQRPCGDNAEKVEVHDSTQGVDFSGDDSGWDNVKYANKEREINRKVEKHRQTLEQLKKAREEKLSQLRAQKQAAAKSETSKWQLRKLSREIYRVKREYDKNIHGEEVTIRKLQKELETDWK